MFFLELKVGKRLHLKGGIYITVREIGPHSRRVWLEVRAPEGTKIMREEPEDKANRASTNGRTG